MIYHIHSIPLLCLVTDEMCQSDDSADWNVEFEFELEMETRYQVYCVYYFRLACSAPFLWRLTPGASQ